MAAAGADRDRDAAYVGGERQRADQRDQLVPGLLGSPLLAGPGEVEVDDGRVAVGPGGHLVGDGGGQRAGGVAELVDGAERGDEVGRPGLVEDVVGDHERPAAVEDPQVVQVELAVVPPDQHLEHRLALGHALLQALGEEADDLLGDRGQRVDPLGAVGRARRRRAR